LDRPERWELWASLVARDSLEHLEPRETPALLDQRAAPAYRDPEESLVSLECQGSLD